MKRVFTLLIAIMLLSVAGTGLVAAEEITLTGSTTILPLAARWSEAFTEIHPDVSIIVFGGGSGVGISALIAGATDIAMASRFMRTREFEAAVARGALPVAHEIAIDGLSIIVHPDNPITELTIEQVRAIYIGDITNWNELGGPNKRIVAFSRDTASGTFGFFEDEVLDGALMHPGVLFKPSNAAIAGAVAGTRGGIGFVGIGFVGAGVRAVPVAHEGNPFVYPSLETIADGTYPLARPLFLFTNGWPEGIVMAFIRFVQSPAGQELVLEEGFGPIPRN